jgi:hypothetical protein
MLRPFLCLCGVVSLLTAHLLVYSQTEAFAWDEGFHLLAAQLIKSGKRPYLDFCFPQTPLNAYWNAFWMGVFGESWRTAHALAAVATGGAILLTADFLLARFPVTHWRLAAALTAALTVGLNQIVFYFGTIGQAYGLCLFLLVAAFRLSILAVDRKGPLLPGCAGFLAGAGAMSSLLTAPVGPVLLIWILIHNRAGSRLAKFAAFLVGSAMAFQPLLWLFVKSPRQVYFSVIQYHLLYRQVGWPGAIRHDLEVMASSIDSSQALLLGLLAAAGLLFIVFRSQWDRPRRAEFYLCGWLALALWAQISSAHPNFPQYFILLVPFLSILASVGPYSIASQMYHPDRAFWPVLIFTVLLSLGLAKSLYEEHDDVTWHDFEEISRKVDQVTPPNAPLLADEHVYFLTRRPPPSGMELRDSHKLELPAAVADSMLVVSGTELDRQIKAGVFSTIETCTFTDEKIQALGLGRLYSQKAEIEDCAVFWDRRSQPLQ